MLEAKDFSLFSNNKPLTYAFRQHFDKSSSRQPWQLDFIFQFTTAIFHIKDSENILADTLSRVNAITITKPIDYSK